MARPIATNTDSVSRRIYQGVSALLLLFVGLGPAVVYATAEPGQTAPPLFLKDVNDQPVPLNALKGRWVVLEWTNPDCPFVQKHYKSGNMQATQRHSRERNVVWIQINSTNPNHPEYKTAAQMATWNKSLQATPTVIALDIEGQTGRAYGARTTPQMVLINPNGRIDYHGAIDSIRSANPADIANAINYVKQAIEETLAGKPVSVKSATPYGCSVKY